MSENKNNTDQTNEDEQKLIEDSEIHPALEPQAPASFILNQSMQDFDQTIFTTTTTTPTSTPMGTTTTVSSTSTNTTTTSTTTPGPSPIQNPFYPVLSGPTITNPFNPILSGPTTTTSTTSIKPAHTTSFRKLNNAIMTPPLNLNTCNFIDPSNLTSVLNNVKQHFRTICNDVIAYMSKSKIIVTQDPETFIPWNNSIKTLFLSVGLDSVNKMNKWNNIFSTHESFRVLTNNTRKGNAYREVFEKLVNDEYVQILDKFSQVQLFIIYRAFMDVFINLERKLFSVIVSTIGSDLQYMVSDFVNLNDTLLLYCKITKWHIRSNAVTLQERVNTLNSSEKYVLKDPIMDPGVLSEILQRESKLINELGGSDELMITMKALCILFRKGINHTIEGRDLYKSTFEKIDSSGETYNYQRIRHRIEEEYRDYILPKLQQIRNNKAYVSQTSDNFDTKEMTKEIEAHSVATNPNKKTSDGIKYGLCFEYVRKGKCPKGSSCKYVHSDELKSMIAQHLFNSDNSSNIEETLDGPYSNENYNHAHYSNSVHHPSDNQNYDYYNTDSGYHQHFYEPTRDEQSYYASRSNWRPSRGRGGKGKGNQRPFPRRNFNSYGRGGKGGKSGGKGKGNNNQRFANSSWEQIVPPTPLTAADARVMELNQNTGINYHSNGNSYNYDFNNFQTDNETPYYDDDYY